jgi:hypothetical protein
MLMLIFIPAAFFVNKFLKTLTCKCLPHRPMGRPSTKLEVDPSPLPSIIQGCFVSGGEEKVLSVCYAVFLLFETSECAVPSEVMLERG